MREFAYHRSISPTLAVLLGLAIVETMVLHVVAVALWGWTVALILGVLDLSLVGSLIWLLRAIRRDPVTLSDDMLVMRVGSLRTLPIPRAQIAGLRASWDAETLKQKGIVNMALATWPNVFIDIAPPIRTRRGEVRGIAHKLDDPEAFQAEIKRLLSDV